MKYFAQMHRSLTTFLLMTFCMGTLSAEERGPLANDQSFTYSHFAPISTLDPHLVNSIAEQNIIRDLFEGLLNEDAIGNPVPGAAESWKAADKNTTYTFKLRKDGKWSNGRPLTAHDFVYSWRRAVTPATKSPFSWYFEMMSITNVKDIISGEKEPDTLGVSAIDDFTLKVTLDSSLPYLPKMVTHPVTFPVARPTIETYGPGWTLPANIVSNGAYSLVEWKEKERVVRRRNPLYWNNEETTLNKVVLQIIPDQNAAVQLFKKGKIDRVDIPAGQYPDLKRERPDEVHSVPRQCVYYYVFNLSPEGPEAFKNAKVRQALSYAIDRKFLIDNILKGGQTEAYTFTPATTAGLAPTKIPYAEWQQQQRDAKAVELMREAGYGPGRALKFNLLYNKGSAHEVIADTIAQMWKKKLGVEATVADIEWTKFLEARGRQRFDMARSGWCGDFNEPSTFLDLVTSTSSYNDAKYTSAEVDRLIADSKISMDPSQNYSRVEEILSEDMPLIPLYHYSETFLLNPAIKGWPYQNARQYWYSRTLYRAELQDR